MAHAAALLILLPAVAQAAAARQLQIYFIDVEGGQSTLVVTPAGQTLLIDAGWAGDGGYQSVSGSTSAEAAKARDPGRIVAAMRAAGVDHIDYLLVTHFHRDHIGGIPELAQLVPVRTFIDHGSAYPLSERSASDSLDVAAFDAYVATRVHGRHLQPKPGDRLPLRGIDVRVVSADRATLHRPLAGAGGANLACRSSALPSSDELGQNPRSTGVVVRFGKFRFLDLGDLSGQPLFNLICPTDRIGAVDVYLVAHHGAADAADPATLAAFRPRVAVVNNALRKGGQLPTLQMLRSAREVESWQLHAADGASEENAPAERIANLDDASANWLRVTAHADGSFSVANQRTGASKAYGAR